MDSMNARLEIRKTQMQLKLKRSKALEKVKLFSGLNEEAMKALVNKMKLKSFNEGDCLFKEGDDAKSFHIVVHVDQGACIRVTCADKGNEEGVKELRRLELFAYLGESALQDGGSRTASCTAWGGKVQTLALSKKAWNGLITLGYVPENIHTKLRKQASQNRREQESRTVGQTPEIVNEVPSDDEMQI
eukprot:g3744.t1